MENLQLGSKGPTVELLQSMLIKLNLYAGEINGIFEEQLLDSVKQFQLDFGLSTTGIVDNETWVALSPYINGYISYTIVPGDTIFKISQKFNTTINQIAVANPQIDVYRIFPEQQIIVPFGRIVPTNISYSSNIVNLNISSLKVLYPFLQIGTFGRSVTKKTLPMIRLGTGSNEAFYSAAIHANEWITSILLMKFLEDFCIAYVNNTTIFGYSAREIFNKSSIYIAPICNPDGVDLVTGEIQPRKH